MVVLCAFPPGAAAQSPTGGAPTPSGTGGAEYGVPVGAKRATARARPRSDLRAARFAVRPRRLVPGGPPARLVYRVDGSSRRVRVRIELVRPGDRSATVRIRLGWKPTGERRVNRWTVPTEGLPAGRYFARLHAVDDRGRRLVRSARASGRTQVRVEPPPPAVPPASGSFPIQGPWTWGGKGSEFGADRGTHRHQGQDLMAEEGTPVVSPVAGRVHHKAHQSGGAGHYVVVRGADGRDYVFMHLASGSIPVRETDAVAAGQIIGGVGSTGRSSAPHLHFEIWPCGWQEKGCRPIDPRPDLEAWATASGS